MRIFVIVVLYRPRAGGRQKVRSSYRNLSVNFGCVARHVRLVCLPVVSIFTLHFLLTTLSSIRPWLCTESHYLFSSTALYGITTRTPHSQHSSTTQWRYEFCRTIRRQSRLTWHTGERECRREKLYTSARTWVRLDIIGKRHAMKTAGTSTAAYSIIQCLTLKTLMNLSNKVSRSSV